MKRDEQAAARGTNGNQIPGPGTSEEKFPNLNSRYTSLKRGNARAVKMSSTMGDLREEDTSASRKAVQGGISRQAGYVLDLLHCQGLDGKLSGSGL